ncbi:MAG TPA: DUF5662 family protein, partial [Pseudobdellovibrionaceae bacterium]|nr:DUF5662 family protein [Pseudobdellovibrionaceae bacterium]
MVSDLIHRMRTDADILTELINRVMEHDLSKLEAPEKELYDKYTPVLAKLTYGTPEYRQNLEEMGEALRHHYKVNRHHPEHFENGINGMTLTDLVEMLADWKAASLRHDDGDIVKSLEINKKRFEIDDQLFGILKNTVREMQWDKDGSS